MKYQLQVYVPEGQNEHHPEGGWFNTGKPYDRRQDLQHIIDVSNNVQDRVNMRRSAKRILELEEVES